MKKRLLKLMLLLLLTSATAYAQTVTGTVTSAKDGSPVPGVSILVKGTTTGTSTDANGKFSLQASENSTLVVSFIGFKTKDVLVGAQSALEISLEEDVTELNEVVVTALGIARESKTLVYATQSVKPAQLTEVRDANNVLNSLQGKIANATITQGSGGPGSGARIVLRGNRSIQQSNNALIVIDGVPVTNNTNSSPTNDFGAVAGSDGASSINPDDIESVTVLRGASAAALYGSAAGNGVIVITTKKGKAGNVSINVNSGVTFETPFALPRFQDGYGQGNSGNLDSTVGESWGAKMEGQSYTNHLGEERKYTSQKNNVSDFFRTGTTYNNSIGISGGSEKMQTYLSYTNNKIQGIVPKNDLSRHTVNLRLSNQISKRFSTDGKINYVHQQIDNRPRTGEENAPVIDLYQIPRNVSTADAKRYMFVNNIGIPTPEPWPSTLSSIYQNPYWVINNTAINENRDRLNGFVSAKFNLTDWLNIQGRANLDKIFDRTEEIYSQGTILWATKAGGYYSKSNIETTQQWYDLMLEGNNSLSEDFKVDYRIGAIVQNTRNSVDRSLADGLNVTNKFSLNFATTPAFSSSSWEVETQSLFGQVNFAYKEVLFLDASVRNDWDSRLPSPYSFAYPSVGVSGILSDMVTMPSAISFLKLNANYAVVGNGGQSQVRFNTYQYSQGAGAGFISNNPTLAIPNLKPELVKNIEVGLEARFVNDRIGLTATYYKSNSTNQLLQIGLPPATGYQNQYINAGDIQNKGFELVLNATPVKNENLTWDIAFNLGHNKNKIIELSEFTKITYLGGGFGRSATPVVKEGGSFGDMLAYQWKKDSNGRYVVSSTGVPVTSEEQELIGNFNPKATLGLTNTINYKNLSLRLLMDGRVGGVAISGTEMNLAFSGITEETEKFREGNLDLNGVDGEGNPVDKSITSQQFWQAASGKRYGIGEFFAYDATSFRVRELSIGYNIPVPSGMVIKSAKLSFVARNLMWLYRGESLLDIPGIGKRKMWFDPDMSLGNGNFQGVEYGTLPSTRSIGFNLQFIL